MPTVSGEYPGGTVLYHCPLCPWVLAVPPLSSVVAGLRDMLNPRLTAVAGILTVEDELGAHLACHELVEWVREVMRLRSLLANAGVEVPLGGAAEPTPASDALG